MNLAFTAPRRRMTLNLTQIKDLEFICRLAQEYYEPEYGLDEEQTWLKRIRKYQRQFEHEIAKGLDPVDRIPVLHTDPARIDATSTGIMVRALDPYEKPLSVDIAQLTYQSLLSWLRSRGGYNEWAEHTVALLLGHKVDDDI